MTRLSKTTIAALLLAAAIACQQQQVTPTQEQLGEANRTILANARKVKMPRKSQRASACGKLKSRRIRTMDRNLFKSGNHCTYLGAGSGPGFDFVVGFRQGRPRGAWINVTCIIEGSSPSYSHERKVRYKFDDGKTGANIWTISDNANKCSCLVLHLLRITQIHAFDDGDWV